MRKILALLAASFYLVNLAGAEIPPAEKLLPDDTIVMFTLPDFNKARDIYQNSPFGRLWNDPSMKPFKEKFLGALKTQIVTPLEHDLGVHLDDYTNLPQGQLTFALTQNGWPDTKGSEPAGVFLLDTKGNSNQLKTNLTDLKKKWVDAGKKVKTEKIRDLDFSDITLSSENMPKSLAKPPSPAPSAGATDPADAPEPKPETKSELYIGQAGSLLIIGNSPKVIEKILVRLSGGAVNTLGDLAAFDADSAMFHKAPLFGWLNVKALVDGYSRGTDTAAGAETSASPMGFKPEKVISAIGLNGLKSIAMSYVFTSEGAQFNLKLSVPESSRTGIFKIIAGEPKDINPPPFVPADVVKFQRWRLDGQKTYGTLRKILGDISPAGLGGLDFMLTTAEANAKDKDPNFDINKALFGNLGDDLISYSRNPKSTAPADLSSAPSLFLLGSPNPDQLANAMKSLFLLYGGAAAAPADREFLGHKIHSIPLPATPTPDGSPAQPRVLNYTSSGGYIAITTDPGLLEEYLRSGETPPKPLRDLPGLSDATQKVAGGGGTSLFGFSNESESTRVLFDALKKDPVSADPLAALTPMAMAVGLGDVKIKDWFDLTLLPTFDKVSKYFYFTVYASSANADGIDFKFFAPVPPQLKQP